MQNQKEASAPRRAAAVEANPNRQVLEALFPGRKVTIPETGIVAHVYPLGWRHMRDFASTIATATQIIMLGVAPGEQDPNKVATAAISRAMPFILEKGLDLVAECIRLEAPGVDAKQLGEITIDDLPHWAAPLIVEAWLEESFGDEMRRDPWIAATERAIEKVTGRKVSILGTLSSFSSRQGTGSTTSSSEGNPVSPTADGVSDNSDSGRSAPPASTG